MGLMEQMDRKETRERKETLVVLSVKGQSTQGGGRHVAQTYQEKVFSTMEELEEHIMLTRKEEANHSVSQRAYRPKQGSLSITLYYLWAGVLESIV